jgi:hypothetical protein
MKAAMDNLDPEEQRRFKQLSEELSTVGQRHDLPKERIIQAYLYYGAVLAQEFDVEYEIDGTNVTVSTE